MSVFELTAINIGAISLMEPQHPRNETTRMTEPIAIATFAAER